MIKIIITAILSLGIGALVIYLILSPKIKQIEKINDFVKKENESTLKKLEINKELLEDTKKEFSLVESNLFASKKQLEYTNQQNQEMLSLLSRQRSEAEIAAEDYKNKCLKEAKAVLLNTQEKYDIAKEQYKEEYFETLEDMTKTYLEEITKYKNELSKIKSTKQATLEAIRKEKETKENKDKYRLIVSENDLSDIKLLERIKKDLNKPRLLSMLIWQNFYRTNMTNLCNNVLGTKSITGIYKITNQITDECYIGQAANVADRWKEHAKCGLGIDTPSGNKLYQAMMEYGIWNFTWELLESCPRDQLNEKEKYFIDLYDSCNFGYNSNKGIS